MRLFLFSLIFKLAVLIILDTRETYRVRAGKGLSKDGIKLDTSSYVEKTIFSNKRRVLFFAGKLTATC